MIISNERIERAAKALDNLPPQIADNAEDMLRVLARTVLEADAPEIAIAEVRAYEDGMRHRQAPILAASLRIAETRGIVEGLKEARDYACSGFSLGGLVNAIDARISALTSDTTDAGEREAWEIGEAAK